MYMAPDKNRLNVSSLRTLITAEGEYLNNCYVSLPEYLQVPKV